mgnify:CR=1 FL=1
MFGTTRSHVSGIRSRRACPRLACTVLVVGLLVEPASVGAARHVPTAPTSDEAPTPRGGLAARIRDGDDLVPGELYLLVASPSSDEAPQVRDEVAYNPAPATVHPQVESSIANAGRTMEDLVGLSPSPRRFTGAPGGGLSGGLAYFLAHLDLATGGAVADGLAVAATGRLGHHAGTGRVSVVQHVPAKVAAARVAGVAVVFVPVDHDPIHEPGVRVVRALGGSDAGRLAGATQVDGVLDVVEVRHVADVVGYLCGAGSVGACDIEARMDDRGRRSASTGADRRG